MQRHILFLTSTNLACNPRCLKEVRLALASGARVTVVAYNLHNWTTAIELRLNKELSGVSFCYLDASRKPLFSWLLATFLERLGRILSARLPRSEFWAAMGVGKRSFQLLRWVNNSGIRPDLVIGHNPMAFYPAARMAIKASCVFGLDVEDYHPGEGNSHSEQMCAAHLMRRLLPKAAYVSFASPMIREYSERLVAPARDRSWIVVNNSFSRADFPKPYADKVDGPVRIVWFSQFVDYSRGLEKILPVLDGFNDRIELTLIGSARPDFIAHEISGRHYIRCVDTVPQQELHRMLSSFDIGLALEDGKTDLNRDLCLTNKIWSYLLAGLYIVASDTQAQRRFLVENPEHGFCIDLEGKNVAGALDDLFGRIAAVRAKKQVRYEQAKSMSWETESEVLTTEWNGSL
jgi:hypothetical protein